MSRELATIQALADYWGTNPTPTNASTRAAGCRIGGELNMVGVGVGGGQSAVGCKKARE